MSFSAKIEYVVSRMLVQNFVRLAVKGQTGGSYRSSTFVPSFEGQNS